MKKLMIAAAMVCAAVVGQAASCEWGIENDSCIMPGGGEEDYLEGGTIMLYLGTVGINNGAFTGLDTATLLAIGEQDPNSYWYGSNGKVVPLDTLESDAAGQAYSLVLLDQDGVTDLKTYEGSAYVFTGDSLQGTDPMSGATWALMTSDTAVGGGDWKTVSAVPEPTSGLLLLLGVAGLALRRRRA